MEFCILDEQEFQRYSEARDDYNMWQTVDMADQRRKEGFEAEFMGVRDEHGNLLCAAMMSYRVVQGYRQYYAPRGFLIDYKDTDLLTFFVEQMKVYCKKNKSLSIRIDPYVPYVQRDLEGNVVEGGYENKYLVDKLVALGFKHTGFTRGIDLTHECRWIYVINLEGMTEKTLLDSFERKARRSVQKTIKYKIYTKELNHDTIDEFVNVMESTSERREFENRSKKYYLELMDTYGSRGHLKYLSAVMDVDNYIASLNEDKQKELDTIADCDKKLAQNPKSKKINNKKKVAMDVLATYEKHIVEAEALKAEKGKEITLSSGVFFINKNEILCLFSGVYEEYMQFASPYAMHWQMMKYGIEHGIKRYNLYGISGIFDESAEDYGVYLFKKGFNGEVIELVGDFELSLTPMNSIYHKLSDLKNRKK